MDWIALMTGVMRTSMWAIGTLIVIFAPGRLGDVPHRRPLIGVTFGLATFNATLLTIGSSGLGGKGFITAAGAFGTLVVAGLLASLIVSAYGPRVWNEHR